MKSIRYFDFCLLVFMMLKLMACASGQVNEQSLYDKLTQSGKYTLYCIRDSIATFKSFTSDELYQIELKSHKFVNHFAIDDHASRMIYENSFKDNGKQFELIQRAFRLNDIKESPCKIKKVFIANNDKIYFIIQCQQAIPVDTGRENRDFKLQAFFVFISLRPNQEPSVLAVHDYYIEPGYYFNGNGDFIVKGDSLVAFTLLKQNISEKDPNYYLGEWVVRNDGLHFLKLLPYEIPDFNKIHRVGYGMLDFIFRDSIFAPYSTPEFYFLNSFIKITVPIDEASTIPERNLNHNSNFHLAFSLCDFVVAEKNLKILYRKNENFYFEIYSLEKHKLVNREELKNYKVSDLERFPFFASNSDIILHLKKSYIYNYTSKQPL